MRTGFVLIELIAAMIIAALLAAIAIPKFIALGDAAAVRDETLRVVIALDAARGTAIRLGTLAQLSLADTAYRVTAVVGVDTVIGYRATGPTRAGVTIAGASTAIGFGSDGLGLGLANRTITLSKGSASRRVVVSKYGRLTY